MALAESARYPGDSATPRREPLWRNKILRLTIGGIVVLLTIAFAAQRATGGARAVLDSRLYAAGNGVDAGLVDVESEQLSVVRAISFTPGVATDLAAHDGPDLNTLVAPLTANSTVPMVDMVVPDGRVLLAVRSKGAPLPVRTHAGLPALEWALAHGHGPRGGRIAQIVVFPRGGATLVTIGPIMSGNRAVGAVMAMTPLANVLGRLSQEVSTDITAYDSDGNPVATTAAFRPKPLPQADAEALIGGSAIETRYVSGNNRETLGRLIVDHTAQAVLGVSLPDDSGSVGWNVALYGIVGLICTLLALAPFWALVHNARRRA